MMNNTLHYRPAFLLLLILFLYPLAGHSDCSWCYTIYKVKIQLNDESAISGYINLNDSSFWYQGSNSKLWKLYLGNGRYFWNRYKMSFVLNNPSGKGSQIVYKKIINIRPLLNEINPRIREWGELKPSFYHVADKNNVVTIKSSAIRGFGDNIEVLGADDAGGGIAMLSSSLFEKIKTGSRKNVYTWGTQRGDYPKYYYLISYGNHTKADLKKLAKNSARLEQKNLNKLDILYINFYVSME